MRLNFMVIQPLAKTKSIKQEIRLMDKLMRNANNAYPRISPFRIFTCFESTKKNDPKYTMWLYDKSDIIDGERRRMNGYSLLNMFAQYTRFVRYSRLGNCGESSAIMMSSLIANGYKDSQIARLVFEASTKDLKTNKITEQKIIDTTHEFVVRNLAENADPSNPKTYGKNLIIIDAWDGFCGNLQEGFKRFYDTFMDGIRVLVNKEKNIEITFRPKLYFCPKEPVESADVAIFRSNFPELVMK